jgi:hypothetical protein
MKFKAAMRAQKLLATLGHGHPQPLDGRSARDVAAIDRVLPDRQARARGSPRLDHFGIESRLARDPLDEIEHQCVRRLGHRVLRSKGGSTQNAIALVRVNSSQPP